MSGLEQPSPDQSPPAMSEQELGELESMNEATAREAVQIKQAEIGQIMDSWNTPISPEARAAGKEARDKGISDIGVAPGPLPLDVSIDDQILAQRRDARAAVERAAQISNLEQATSQTAGEDAAAAQEDAAIARVSRPDTDPAPEGPPPAAPAAQSREYVPRHAAPGPVDAADIEGQPSTRRGTKEAIARRWRGPGQHTK